MQDLESALKATFDDRKLSKNEKYAFADLLEPYQQDPDKLNFVRNLAFDIVRDHQYSQTNFDSDAFKWLEHIIKVIDKTRSQHLIDYKEPSAFFSPGNKCKSRIISTIANAKTTIDVCVFTISDNQISEALINAHKRSVKVRVVSDNDKSNDRGSDIDFLAEQGIPVVKDISSHHMHHKFAIIDQRTLINGSFNWTRSASEYNEENITILYDQSLIQEFNEEFEKLWQRYS